MKEKLLLLCMTYPTESKKYKSSVCMAGITTEGEFRRIYPVSFDQFYKRRDKFHKRYFVEYELRERGDHRKESWKIYDNTIKVLPDEVPYDEIRDICDEYVLSIEELEDAWREDKTSLGIIKPQLWDLKVIKEKEPPKTLQQTLFDGCVMPEMLTHAFVYHFNCSNQCEKIHKCRCLDIEIGQLFRKLKTKNTLEQAIPKLKAKFFDWMKNTRDPYFMMGTHAYHPNHWMIISVLYPPKLTDIQMPLTNYF